MHNATSLRTQREDSNAETQHRQHGCMVGCSARCFVDVNNACMCGRCTYERAWAVLPRMETISISVEGLVCNWLTISRFRERLAPTSNICRVRYQASVDCTHN